MSEPTNTDFTKGRDFTGLNPAVAADFNQLVDNAVPFAEVDPIEGKGLIIVTRDDFDGTPFVPDAASTNTDWKRYLWMRVDYNEAAARRLYKWNDSITSDPTYLKWEAFDNAALQAEIDAIEVDITSLEGQYANLVLQLNAVNTLATNNAADIATIEGQIPSLVAAVSTTLPAADAANAAAAAAAQAAANAASAVVSAAAFFTSAEYAIADGLIADVAHGLGAKPKFIRWVLVAQASPQAGYTQGDEVDVYNMAMQDNQTNMFIGGASTTNVFFTKSNVAGDEYITHKTTGADVVFDASKWTAKCYAWK